MGNFDSLLTSKNIIAILRVRDLPLRSFQIHLLTNFLLIFLSNEFSQVLCMMEGCAIRADNGMHISIEVLSLSDATSTSNVIDCLTRWEWFNIIVCRAFQVARFAGSSFQTRSASAFTRCLRSIRRRI
jgi:hypothetical protein